MFRAPLQHITVAELPCWMANARLVLAKFKKLLLCRAWCKLTKIAMCNTWHEIRMQCQVFPRQALRLPYHI